MVTSIWDDLVVAFNDDVVNWTPQRMYPNLSDGLKVGDASQEYWVITLTDGPKFSDSLDAKQQLFPNLSDGIKLSDSLAAKQHLFPNLSDGIKLSDSLDVNCTFYCELEDGFNVGDFNQEYFVELLEDGVKFEDFTLYKKEKSELTIDFTAVPITLQFDCKLDFNDNFTVKPHATIPPFRINSIVFTFKANPKDYDLQ